MIVLWALAEVANATAQANASRSMQRRPLSQETLVTDERGPFRCADTKAGLRVEIEAKGES